MDLANYILLNHAAALDMIETAKEDGENYEFELSALMAALYADPELSEYSESEIQAAVAELINE